MKPGSPRNRDKARLTDEARAATPAREAQPNAAPAHERRGSHRVADDQKSGQGSLSALSKLKMQERKRAAVKPGYEHDPD